MFKKLCISLLALSMIFSATACSQGSTTSSAASSASSQAASSTASASGEKQKITVVLDWTPNTNHTGLYVAKELGYFDEAGLDVELIQPPEDGATTLVASGGAQFGIDFQDSLAPAFAPDKALPVTAVAAVIQHNTSGIISMKDKGIASPKGMAGKTYATWDMPVEKAVIKSVVEKDGGDYSKINMVPSTVTDIISALKTKIDAVWIFYAWDGIATKVKGLDTNYFAFKDIDPVFDYYTPVIIANNDFLKQNPDAAKKFLAAAKKGYEYSIENPDKAADILLKAAPELDPQIVKESQKWLAGQYKAEVTRWGYIDAKRWDGFYKWLSDNKLVDRQLPAGTGFSNDYLPQ